MVSPGEDHTVTESATPTMWFDDQGILCSIAKKHAHVKTIAWLTRSPRSKKNTNLLCALNPPMHPVRMFNDPEEGRGWLKQYLNNE